MPLEDFKQKISEGAEFLLVIRVVSLGLEALFWVLLMGGVTV